MTGLITGASRGLGLELVKLGLSSGDMVLAASRGQSEKERDLWQLQAQYPETMIWLKMDVTDENEVAAAAREAGRRVQKLDYIVNNAGVLFESKFDTRDPVQTLDIAMLRKTLEVNAVGPAIVLKYFIPLLYLSDAPSIVSITSEGAALSPKGCRYPAYCVSKSALNMYTQKVRNYLAEKEETQNVKVYMIHPGRMDTEMGVENAQISPAVPAKAIYGLVHSRNLPETEIPFIDYTGKKL